MSRYDIYGIGNALVDMEFEVSDDFLREKDIGKGLMTLVDEKRQIELLAHLHGPEGKSGGKWASGGSAANTIIAASHFGSQCFYSCKVANDESGDFYMNDLAKAGVDTNLDAGRDDGITGHCLVLVTPDAERTMNTFLGISETISTAELVPDAVRQAKYLYLEGYLVSSPSGRDAAIEARRIAEASGVKTALTFSDPAMVQFFREGLREMVGDGVDLLFCNEAEAMNWTGTKTVEDAIATIKQIARGFAITLGSKGAVVWDGETMSQIEPNIVKAVDTNGAGDMFAGAFLYGITHNRSYAEAGRLASLAAARVVSRFGPRLPAEDHKMVLNEVCG